MEIHNPYRLNVREFFKISKYNFFLLWQLFIELLSNYFFINL